MPFKVIVTRDFDHMSEVAAGLVVDDIRRTLASRPSYVLGLATGNSPTGLYKHLAREANAGEIDPARITSFNLDEYVGLPGENAEQRALHRESYSFFMIQELFGLLATNFHEVNIPLGTLIDQDKMELELKTHPGDWTLRGNDRGKAIVIHPEAGSDYLRWLQETVLDGYADKIARAGGVDLHIVGVGGRGHVGFHEVGIPFEGSEVLLVKLDDNTVHNAVVDGHFASRSESPTYAVTMGAELVYRAKSVLLLANGKRKADAIAKALFMEPDCSVPISYGHTFARSGGNMIFVVDRLAAAGFLGREAQLRERGIDVEDIGEERASVPVESLQFFCAPGSAAS
ncbi:MAG: 6-phosphogluconolactonase [Acidobacteriota bacterium]|jgi:glucosamine-6-phosphate deaminase|nr:6-phosphogluconolactonase [Acidobacteriota bacterium]